MLSESTFAQFNFELQGHIGALGNADDQGASDIPALSHPQRAAWTTFKKWEEKREEGWSQRAGAAAAFISRLATWEQNV